jgi:hypothetical protein
MSSARHHRVKGGLRILAWSSVLDRDLGPISSIERLTADWLGERVVRSTEIGDRAFEFSLAA